MDDSRTLHVDVDSHGLLYKDFWEWVHESYHSEFALGRESPGVREAHAT